MGNPLSGINTRHLNDALSAVDKFGKEQAINELLPHGTIRYNDVGRYGGAAKEKFINWLGENLATGNLSIRNANRIIKATPHFFSGDAFNMAKELAGGNLNKTSQALFRGEQAAQDIASGAARGVRTAGPKDLVNHLHEQMLEGQNRILGILDEFH
jgi:hypothetical protein